MALQFEDVVDCCIALYGDENDFLFLFDHSCGHDRKAAGALDAKALNVGYGGGQPHMSPSLIVMRDGYLGEYPRMVDPGDTQSFRFEASDDGPFYLKNAEREKRKYDRPTGKLGRKKRTRKTF